MTQANPSARHRLGITMLGVTIVAGVLGMALAAPATAAPPAKRTYFTVLLGLDEPLAWRANGLRFTKTKVCTGEGDCGTWIPTESLPDGAFTFELELEADGAPVRLEGHARIETRGKRDTIGGAAHAVSDGRTFNFALTGNANWLAGESSR